MEPIYTFSRDVRELNHSAFHIFFNHFKKDPQHIWDIGGSDRYSINDYPGVDDVTKDSSAAIGPKNVQAETAKLFAFLKENHNISGDDITSYSYVSFESNKFISYFVINQKDIVIRLLVSPTSEKETQTNIILLGMDNTSHLWNSLVKYSNAYIPKKRQKPDQINIITQDEDGFGLTEIDLKNKNVAFSFDHYNADFEVIANSILTNLKTANESGLVLLHGAMGTGKTTMLKHLLHTITTKKIIYLPPDLTSSLSSPGFLAFIMQRAHNSILLIEDAENVLLHREAGGNQAVANILNISNGILGDILNMQIVCTFNTPLADIDPALLRPGRLIASYEFKALEVDRSTALMHKLYGSDVKWTPKKLTLAEIFNFNGMPLRNDAGTKTNVGFI